MRAAIDRLASHSTRVCDAHGRPLLRCPTDWTGPELEGFVIPSAAECGPQTTGTPTLFVARSGSGRRWYRSGARVLELVTGPLIDTYSAHYERDHARWEGTQGESIGVRLPAAVTRRLMHDEADHFDLRTLYEVDDPRLSRLVLELADEVQGGFPNGRLYAEGLSLALLGWLSQHYRAEPDRAAKGGGLSISQKQRVRDVVESRLGERLSVEDLADAIGLSAFHFARLFKSSFGETPHRHVMRRRVEVALAALRDDPQRPIADIALAFGFASQAHLTDSLRRQTGMTPASARRA